MKTPQQILDESNVPVNYTQLKLEADKARGFVTDNCDVKEKTMNCDDMYPSSTDDDGEGLPEDNVSDYLVECEAVEKIIDPIILKNIEKLRADKEVVERERPSKNGFCRLDTSKLVKDLREKLSKSEES